VTAAVRKKIVLWGFPAALAFAVIWRSLPLFFNWTPSVPIGVYWMTGNRTAPYLAFCMSFRVRTEAVAHGYEPMRGNCPDGTAWILKPNLQHAHAITFTDRGFAIDARLLPNTAPLAKDRFGRPLPHYPFGTYLVSPQEVWVVSTYNNRSYDSRYFGPIPAASVLFYAYPVLVLP
jgi:conjugative transfer signal peptidase TraF